MKIWKQINRSDGDKTYYRYIISLPLSLLEQLKWKEGKDLKVTIKGKKLILE